MIALKNFISENKVNEIFKRQDEFLKKMIDTWKSNDKLSVFDHYFNWKTNKISIKEFIANKDKLNEMRSTARQMLDKLWDSKNENDDLILIIEAIELELTRVIMMLK